MLNGQESAVLVLDDVHVGDIIDYSYSIKGSNPVFAGHFSEVVPVQMTEPAERILTRVLWPSRRRLSAKLHGCAIQPSATYEKGTTEYVWDMRQVPGVALEDLVPAWYDPKPWVQLSEFQSWAQVDQWALALFRTTSPNSPELSQEIAKWKQIPESLNRRPVENMENLWNPEERRLFQAH